MKLRNRKYIIGSSTLAKKVYVFITNTPSCTCPDFQKQGKNVCCKHILFVVPHVLNAKNLIKTLQDRYMTAKELTLLFQAVDRKVPEEFMPMMIM